MTRRILPAGTGDIIRAHGIRRRRLYAITGMAIAVAIAATCMLIRPASATTGGDITLTAAAPQAAPGEGIGTTVEATAGDAPDGTVFVLSTDGDAVPDQSRHMFDETDTTTIGDEDGATVELRRETDGENAARYLFALPSGRSTRFTLYWSGGPGATLTITPGYGNGAEDAPNHQGEPVHLSWSTAEPDDTGNSATVRKSAAAPAAAANTPPTTAGARDGYDFGQYITKVTVSQIVNGQWVEGTQFTDGTNVRIQIAYTIPDGVVQEGSHTITYQLPQGIQLTEEESGLVYDHGNQPVGHYTIGTDGLITITFDDAFSDSRAFEGQIQFQGTLSANEGGEQTGIDFGAGGTITVIPNPKPTDVHVDKTGFHSDGDGRLHYTLTVSTTQGTNGEITVTDRFQNTNTGATYDPGSFTITRIDANGNRTPVTDLAPAISEQWQGGPQQAVITGLPALNTGERYEIQYTATPGETTDPAGGSTVANNVTATTTGGDQGDDWNSIDISRQWISKTGVYDAATGAVTWTITLNPDGRDIGGWTLQDKITADGVTANLPETVAISPAVDGKNTISLPFTFPEGSTGTYTITYRTQVEGLDPGEDATVSNDAHLTHGDDDYHAGSSVRPHGQELGSTKTFGWHDPSQDSADTGTYQWNATITVPEHADGSETVSLEYSDTIHPLTDGNGDIIQDSHYITGRQLKDMTVTVNGTTLIYGTDYTIYDSADQTIADPADDARYTGFHIRFTPEGLREMAGGVVSLQYSTTVDYTRLTEGGHYVIRNTGGVPGHETTAETDYDRPGRLEKQASETGNISDFHGDGIRIDYETSQGIIHYRLLLRTTAETTGDITVTDILPAGATLQAGTLKAVYHASDWWEDNSGNLTVTAGEPQRNEDGTTTVTLTIGNFSYKPDIPILAVYYDVSIASDPIWADDPALEEHTYVNHASWDDSRADTEVTVDRDVPDVEKTGEQLPEYGADGKPVLDAQGEPIMSNTIRYSIIVNAGGRDLAPGLDHITLWDRLDPGRADAEFQPGAVHLHRYDPDADDHLGVEIDPSLYAFTYDELTHTLTFNLPDETPCVLVYEYVVDRGDATGDLTVSNEAHLTGGSGDGSNDEVTIKDTTSSATASKRELTVYKVDATDYGTLLPKAVFTLEELQDNGTWKTLLDDLTTDENGEFTLSRVEDEHFENFDFKDDTLYRLTETKAPDGYASLGTPNYFVWVQHGKTAEEVRQEMIKGDRLGGVDSSLVRFLAGSGELYVSNEPTDLTVRKLWQDTDGRPTDPGVDNVKITLFQQAVTSNARTVTVTSTGHQSWSQTVTMVANVAEGSPLTIRIGNVWTSSLDIKVGDAKPVTVPAENMVCTYTVDRIDKDTNIRITPTDTSVGNTFGDISFSGYTSPTFVPQGGATEYETVELNGGNQWSYTWKNLPKTDDQGHRVFYHVEETTPVPGFETIYSSNNDDGVGAGELVVVNRATYTLPETGGAGTRLTTVCGLTLLAVTGLAFLYRVPRRKEAL